MAAAKGIRFKRHQTIFAKGNRRIALLRMKAMIKATMEARVTIDRHPQTKSARFGGRNGTSRKGEML